MKNWAAPIAETKAGQKAGGRLPSMLGGKARIAGFC
jgi:hypothetical protein